MTVTLDKFGRILIPKQVRTQLGVVAGDKLELDVSSEERSISIHPAPSTEKKAEIRMTDWGWPVIHFVDGKSRDFDVVALIKEEREERAAKHLGIAEK